MSKTKKEKVQALLLLNPEMVDEATFVGFTEEDREAWKLYRRGIYMPKTLGRVHLHPVKGHPNRILYQ